METDMKSSEPHGVARHPLAAAALRVALILVLGSGIATATGSREAPAQHAPRGDAELAVRNDTAAGVLTVRLGPLDLPAETHHGQVEQAPDRYLEIPVDGWLVAYHPRLTDAAGETIPGRLLHHVAFWNTERPDFLCPEKEEHIFGAGGEMNDWPALPGVGYRVFRGDSIRVSTMFHNPTARDYPETYLEVKVRYVREDRVQEPLKNVYPVWFDVQECGPSGYDLAPGENVTRGEFSMPYSGRLLGVGGHLHDYARSLRLYDESDDREIARLEPELDEEGRIRSMPVVPFLARGGYRLEEGEKIRVTATYENPTGRRLPEGAMGIVVGYFLPDDSATLAGLRPDQN